MNERVREKLIAAGKILMNETISDTREKAARTNNMANFLDNVETLRSALLGKKSKNFKTPSGFYSELFSFRGFD
jgi:hypothetical protein